MKSSAASIDAGKTPAIRVPLKIGAAAPPILSVALAGQWLAVALIAGAITTDGGVQTLCAVLASLISFLALGVIFGVGAGLEQGPSDVVLAPEGLIFEGGIANGRRIGWNEIDAGASRVGGARREKPGDPPELELVIARRAEDPVHGDRSWAEVDRESFAAVLRYVQARCGVVPPATPPVPTGVSMLVCGGCGAALAPTEEAQTTCHSCGAISPVPDDLRDRMRSARFSADEQSELDELTRQLLHHPGANRTRRVFHGLALLAVLVFVIPVVFYYNGVAALGLSCIGAGAWLALGFTASSHVRARQSIRLLTLNSGAAAPERAGDPYRCRDCGAPLPARTSGGGIVCRCVYCAKENIFDLDLKREVASGADQVSVLNDALEDRRRIRRYRGIVVATSMILVLLGLSLVARAHP